MVENQQLFLFNYYFTFNFNENLKLVKDFQVIHGLLKGIFLLVLK